MRLPTPEIVSVAISLIEKGGWTLSCLALDEACRRAGYVFLERGAVTDSYADFILNLNGGEHPLWWNGEGSVDNRFARIAALKAFRKHVEEWNV